MGVSSYSEKHRGNEEQRMPGGHLDASRVSPLNFEGLPDRLVHIVV
jgi:hypothetical protein